MFPLQKPRKRRSEGNYILERRLLDALCLTLRNFANFNPVKDKATVDAHWDMLYSPYQAHLHSASVLIGVYIHISVGFCVARFDRMGNFQEPQNVKRATVLGFTLFLCLY